MKEETKKDLALAGAMAILTFFTTLMAMRVRRYIQMKI